jgi:hypothetical protein
MEKEMNNKFWITKPRWFEVSEGVHELSGPFFSIWLEKNPNTSFYDLTVSAYAEDRDGEQISYTIPDSARELEIARNYCTVYYNEILNEMQRASSMDEPK